MQRPNLTDKQLKYAQARLSGKNQTEACVEAYGYDPVRAAEYASHFLASNSKILAYMDWVREEAGEGEVEKAERAYREAGAALMALKDDYEGAEDGSSRARLADSLIRFREHLAKTLGKNAPEKQVVQYREDAARAVVGAVQQALAEICPDQVEAVKARVRAILAGGQGQIPSNGGV